jgi:hypothetical protein
MAVGRVGIVVLAGKKLLMNLIKEANELVSIFSAALKTSKTNHKSKIPNRKSKILLLRLVRVK